MTVAGLLLAAGEGTRLGRPKALVELGGERLVDRGVRLLRDGGCDPILVVSGAAPVMVAGAEVVHNPRWREGMGTSLRAGLSALPPQAEAVVVALVDQPLIGAEAVRRLRTAFENGAGLIGVAVATYGGARRNPVLLARPHWKAVAETAEGDAGARPYLRANPDLVTRVPCDDCGDPADVDTPEDLSYFRAQFREWISASADGTWRRGPSGPPRSPSRPSPE